MNEPKRWLDDPRASAELKGALRGAARAGELDRVTRARVGTRLGRLGVVPLSAVAWLSLKSAAALGVAGGATVAGALAVVEHYRPAEHAVRVTTEPARPATRPSKLPAATRHSEDVMAPAADPPPNAAAPTLNPPSELPRAGRSSLPSAGPSGSGELAAESALLEQARRSLASSPARTLGLVREHAATFPNGQLAAERRLIEIDALSRAGRRAEARALAERLLGTGGDDLYVGRVRALLQKMNGGR